MTTLLAIDGSLRCCGLALFRDARLAWTGAVKWARGRKCGDAERAACIAAEAYRMLPVSTTDAVIYEWPQVYEGSDADPNDLFGILAVSGDLVGRLAPKDVTSVLPRIWTAGIPKKVDGKLPRNPHTSPRAKAIARRLSGAELAVYEGAKTNDEIDAVGIGLYSLGRGIHLRQRVNSGAV